MSLRVRAGMPIMGVLAFLCMGADCGHGGGPPPCRNAEGLAPEDYAGERADPPDAAVDDQTSDPADDPYSAGAIGGGGGGGGGGPENCRQQ